MKLSDEQFKKEIEYAKKMTEKHDINVNLTLCENCGHDKNLHAGERNCWGKVDAGLWKKDCSCKKFKAKKGLDKKSKVGFDPYESDIITGDPLPKNHSPQGRDVLRKLKGTNREMGRVVNPEGTFNLSKKIFIDACGTFVCNVIDVKEFIKLSKKVDGVQQIQDNMEKSFKGTIRDALKNNYQMDKHYVIVDWEFFHELLEKRKIDKLAGKNLSGDL